MRILTAATVAPLALLSCIVVVNAASTAGCGSQLPKGFTAGGSSNTVKIESSGRSRTYLLYVPENYDISTPAPFYLSYHGGSQDAEDQEELSQMSNPEFNPDGIAVYPQGINQCWEGVPGCDTGNDIEFTSNIISDVSSTYCIDTIRIYASGKSDGGGFLGLLACNSTLSNIIAAFAPVSGAFYGQNSSTTCNPGRSVIPMIEFHGSDDTTIPYDGGSRRGAVLPNIATWLTEWAARDGDDAQNVTTTEFKKEVRISTWKDEVIGYLIHGLGHSWPSTVSNLDSSTGTYLNATTVIIEFFANNTLSSSSASTTHTPTSSGGASSGPSSTATPTASPTAKSAASAMTVAGHGWWRTVFALGLWLFV